MAERKTSIRPCYSSSKISHFDFTALIDSGDEKNQEERKRGKRRGEEVRGREERIVRKGGEKRRMRAGRGHSLPDNIK